MFVSFSSFFFQVQPVKWRPHEAIEYSSFKCPIQCLSLPKEKPWRNLWKHTLQTQEKKDFRWIKYSWSIKDVQHFMVAIKTACISWRKTEGATYWSRIKLQQLKKEPLAQQALKMSMACVWCVKLLQLSETAAAAAASRPYHLGIVRTFVHSCPQYIQFFFLLTVEENKQPASPSLLV